MFRSDILLFFFYLSASLPAPPGEIQYSTPPVPSQSMKEMAAKVNPYSLRAARG